MITIENSELFSGSHHLIEMLSTELTAIAGDNVKTNFTLEAMNNNKALWGLTKNAHVTR